MPKSLSQAKCFGTMGRFLREKRGIVPKGRIAAHCSCTNAAAFGRMEAGQSPPNTPRREGCLAGSPWRSREGVPYRSLNVCLRALFDGTIVSLEQEAVKVVVEVVHLPAVVVDHQEN